MSQVGSETASQLFEMKKADTLSQSELCFERLGKLDTAFEHMKEIINKKECFSVKNLEINGHDLIDLGCPQSRKIGEILNKLLISVINGEIKNERDTLLSEAKELILG